MKVRWLYESEGDASYQVHSWVLCPIKQMSPKYTNTTYLSLLTPVEVVFFIRERGLRVFRKIFIRKDVSDDIKADAIS